ncbi:putative serine/threonine-protein kinase [Syzygium oleosum]|uniref:putative serine/threonine-protein kinase n=1 Tax=Syzygium oleosum TaxID=219896 RepID=UPI0024BA3820|nr:putative serine/threonine-protein kinase [Syzygium oleosum]XP_056162285.1 putative serine/threonine-protein kinase [Syzygium oleosum]XP_056162286.1 putative serine/threonine-protein kinase [Syzygium oleosum]XP_056162287.1 putative serine/threonine-protein kinase [Syzygium oleosum]XP_056162288.1 putative serine/threonine-protein kinase [Syzygium oleosum]
MSSSLASVAAVSAGALALVAVLVGLVWFCMSKLNSSANRNSETGSSDPSALVDWNRGGGSSSGAAPPLSGPQGARQFTMQELELATRQFDESNLIGHGSFGLVYKGLLRDGTVVAIKRRTGVLQPEFVTEVSYLSEIRHRNLVTLLGYCLENGCQMLVFEYLPNGSMCNHLYDTGQESSTKLEFKQRISIALGAAKGLCHLYSLRPPLVHKNFKTANVLVDENFIAKVADAGLMKLLEKKKIEAGPSRASVSVFQDPEAGELGGFSEMSDAYSFGVFLLELVTGEAAPNMILSGHESLIQWVESHESLINLVDPRLVGTFTMDGIRDLMRLTLLCMISPRERRPKMDAIAWELERIREKEMALTTVMGEGTATITPGSELFTS